MSATAATSLARAWPTAAEDGDQLAFPAVIMRGGTSRGAFLLARDLPADPALRDRVILAAYGSPDVRQIDGLGGATPQTSKVAIIAGSERLDADVDYLFGQVAVDRPLVDYGGNCGNLLAAVGPFAVDEGLVAAEEPFTRVAIHNVNTGRVVLAEVPVVGGRARTVGETRVAGVASPGAPVMLDFAAAAGSLGRGLLPTGELREELSGVEVSIVDAANVTVFVAGADIGMTAGDFTGPIDEAILAQMRDLRAAGAGRLGIESEGIPKLYAVAPAGTRTDADIAARGLSFGSAHPAYAATVAACTAAASRIPGTVVADQLAPGRADAPVLRIGHPAGVIEVEVSVEPGPDGVPTLRRAALARTARRLIAGTAFVPRTVLDPA